MKNTNTTTNAEVHFLNNGMARLVLEYGDIRYAHVYDEDQLGQMYNDYLDFKKNPEELAEWEGNEIENENPDEDWEDNVSWYCVTEEKFDSVNPDWGGNVAEFLQLHRNHKA